HCPPPPAGYGAPICLEATENFGGFCALTCDPASSPCPDHMRCAPATQRESKRAVNVCRGGIYRHGDGDEVIEAGEVYGSSIEGCDAGLGRTTAAGGRCIDALCERDEDCPAPPPGHSLPVCDADEGESGSCWLSCETEGSTNECLDGLECGDLTPSGVRSCDTAEQ